MFSISSPPQQLQEEEPYLLKKVSDIQEEGKAGEPEESRQVQAAKLQRKMTEVRQKIEQ